jgi:RimJ/RimL family protein N-acetyltransferase
MGPYVDEFMTKEANTAIGLIDRTEVEEVVYGALLIEPFGELEIDKGKVEFNASAPIEALLGECRLSFIDAFCLRNPTVTNDQARSIPCGYIAWMAVSPEYRRRGSCLAMVSAATDILGGQCKYSVAYCTSPKSKFVFLKAGYEVWGQIKYSSFEVDGACPFESIPDEVSIMVKMLN